MGVTYLTKEGFEKLRGEYRALQQQKRQLADEVNRAAAMGDLRENAEYHAAKERLHQVGMRLTELEVKLANVQLIDDLEIKSDEARLGTQVTLEDEQTHERFSYLLVGPEEADPQNGKISITSPLGKAVLGKKEGERFMLTLPRSSVPYLVVKVERPT